MITDLHIDYDYQPGMDNSCGRPLCCRSDSGPAPTAERTSGKWGDFKCDLNRITLKSMLSEIKNEIKPDMVFWAGDSVPHNVDTLTIESNIEIMKNITADVLAGLGGIKLYPAIGNHDTYPQDVIKMRVPRENVAIQAWGPAWDSIIQDPEQIKTWRDWGYFSLPLTNTKGEKLGKTETRLISLNSNVCYQFNWATFLDYYDPGNMFAWLENELL